MNSATGLQIAALGTMAGAITLAILSFTLVPPIASGMLQAAAISGATAGWLYSNSVTLRVKMRERAISLVDSEALNGDLSKYSRLIAYFMIANHDLNISEKEAELADIYFDYKFDSEGLIFSLLRAGDIFENIAIMVKQGVVDEKIVREYYYGMLLRFFESYRLFLAPIRNLPSWKGYRADRPTRPGTGANMEWLYYRWRKARTYAHFSRFAAHDQRSPWWKRVESGGGSGG